MLRNKPYLLILGFLVTILSGITLSTSTHASALKPKNLEWKAEKPLVYSTPISSPLNDDKGSTYPEIKAGGSYNQAQTPIFVRASQNLYCLFEISKTEIQFDETPPQVDVALNPFYATLFDSIISPNAP